MESADSQPNDIYNRKCQKLQYGNKIERRSTTRIDEGYTKYR